MDFTQAAKLLKKSFTPHNIFDKSVEDILIYLKSQELEAIGDGVHSFTFLVKTGQDASGTHTVWKFRHFAYDTPQVAIELLKSVETAARQKSKTVKIELSFAENESQLQLFLDNGYKQEGKLENHYRFGESCILLGKTL